MRKVYKFFSTMPQRLWAWRTGAWPTVEDKRTAAYFWLRQVFHFSVAFFLYGGAFAGLLFWWRSTWSFGVPTIALAFHVIVQESVHSYQGQKWWKTITDITVWLSGYVLAVLIAMAASGFIGG